MVMVLLLLMFVLIMLVLTVLVGTMTDADTVHIDDFGTELHLRPQVGKTR